MSRKESGDEGEKEVIALIPCPNCQKPLITLPQSNPLFDVQCSACIFRAQVKTCSANPYTSSVVLGAGWAIMEKVIKSGYFIPPVIINYKWQEKHNLRHEIRFYPFVLKQNLNPRKAIIDQGKRVYKMFDYNVLGLPYFTMYNTTTEQEPAKIVLTPTR